MGRPITTLLLRYVRLAESDEQVADHLWFTQTKDIRGHLSLSSPVYCLRIQCAVRDAVSQRVRGTAKGCRWHTHLTPQVRVPRLAIELSDEDNEERRDALLPLVTTDRPESLGRTSEKNVNHDLQGLTMESNDTPKKTRARKSGSLFACGSRDTRAGTARTRNGVWWIDAEPPAYDLPLAGLPQGEAAIVAMVAVMRRRSTPPVVGWSMMPREAHDSED